MVVELNDNNFNLKFDSWIVKLFRVCNSIGAYTNNYNDAG